MTGLSAPTARRMFNPSATASGVFSFAWPRASVRLEQLPTETRAAARHSGPRHQRDRRSLMPAFPAAKVLDASQCVIWLSPYTGDVLADPGTIDDPGNIGQTGVTTPRQSTTSILTSFVQAGGRLCVTGQDVGSTLTLNGTVANTAGVATSTPNFLPDVMNAVLVPNRLRQQCPGGNRQPDYRQPILRQHQCQCEYRLV